MADDTDTPTEPTASAPTADQIAAARALVAEADAAEAERVRKEQEEQMAPLVAFMKASAEARAMLPALETAFAGNRSVMLHVTAIVTGFEGLVGTVGTGE